MNFRQTNMPPPPSAKAGFSPSSGSRLDHDPRLPSQKQVKRGRRRPEPLAAICESEIVPMLRLAPGLRPIAIFEEMGRRHPEIDFGVRRTLERRGRAWGGLHGPAGAGIFRPKPGRGA